MASDAGYFEYIKEQLSGIENISYRKMMGEYIIYAGDRIVGGIYDNRLLIKPVDAAVKYVKAPKYELPYDGAKEMLFIENVDDREFLTGLINTALDEFPVVKKCKK